MGKIDHKQINEQVQVVVSPSLAFWPPGNLGPRAQGMKKGNMVGSMATFLPGSRASLFDEEKRGTFPHLSSNSFTFHDCSF